MTTATSPFNPEETVSTEGSSFTIEDLSRLTGVSRRTIRYYVQMGLVPRPEGERRGALYRQEHLYALLTVRRLAQKGMTLSDIAGLMERSDSAALSAERPIGSIEEKSHVHLGPGLELVVDHARSSLTRDELKRLAAKLLDLLSPQSPHN